MAKHLKTKALAQRPPVEPILLGCYTLTSTGLEVHGKPGIEEHEDVGNFITRAVKQSAWWAAD